MSWTAVVISRWLNYVWSFVLTHWLLRCPTALQLWYLVMTVATYMYQYVLASAGSGLSFSVNILLLCVVLTCAFECVFFFVGMEHKINWTGKPYKNKPNCCIIFARPKYVDHQLCLASNNSFWSFNFSTATRLTWKNLLNSAMLLLWSSKRSLL